MADYAETNELGNEAPETGAEEPAGAPAAQPQQARPENPYSYERRDAYADAGYIPASDAGAMPRS